MSGPEIIDAIQRERRDLKRKHNKEAESVALSVKEQAFLKAEKDARAYPTHTGWVVLGLPVQIKQEDGPPYVRPVVE